MPSPFSAYPSLEARQPLPAWHIPGVYAVMVLAVFIPGRVSRVLLTLPLMAYLVVTRPLYTAGSPADDYNTAAATIWPAFFYVDFFIVSPLEGEELRWIGRSVGQSATTASAATSKGPGEKGKLGITEDECTSPWEKVKWALHLACTSRGIGWSWQSKNIPKNFEADFPRWAFARVRLLRGLMSWAISMAALFVLGFAETAGEQTPQRMAHMWWRAVYGWAGAAWAFNGIGAVADLAASVSVAVGICQPWEWPPLFGPAREAWSVRRVWGVVWHQMVRRPSQKPTIRLSRLFGLRKGTLSSSLLQLYFTFAITFLVHEWEAFVGVRHDTGELRFFASQPLAITFEGFVQWVWRRYGPRSSPATFRFAKVVGFLWVAAWVAFCASAFIKGPVSAGIIGSGFGETPMMDAGQRTAMAWWQRD